MVFLVTTCPKSLKRKLDAIGQELWAKAVQGSDTEDQTIYHYTTPPGLIGILNEGKLWATHIRHFEDKSELRYAETIFNQMLDDVQAPPESIQIELANACRIDLKPRIGGPMSKGGPRPWLNNVLDIYVTCFSTSNSLIEQWRRYANGGAGFAIGFNKRELQNAVQPGDESRGFMSATVTLAKVHYSVDEQKRELRNIFDRYSEGISDSSLLSCYQDAILQSFARHACLFKHPDYSSENEWRIIIETLPARDDVCHRVSATELTPFIKVPLNPAAKLPVASVTIGPGMDQEASARGVQSLFDTKKYRGAQIQLTELLVKPSTTSNQ